MPSPIAHSAVAFVLWPALRNCVQEGMEDRNAGGLREPLHFERQIRIRRWALIGGLLVMLNAPDFDMAPHLLWGGETWLVHGGPTHSLLAGALAACVFATVFYLAFRMNWKRLWIVGAAAWWSHILLDFFTWGGGVAAFWPLIGERFASPVPLFYGVRHSEPWAWNLHLITISTELVFVAVLWFVARPWIRAARHTHVVRYQHIHSRKSVGADNHATAH